MYEEHEPPDIKWNENSIVVFNTEEEPLNAFSFYENKEDSKSMIMCSGELDDFMDHNEKHGKNQVTDEMLYEMYELSELIKNKIYDDQSQKQKLIIDFKE